jgi:hypothetical protein
MELKSVILDIKIKTPHDEILKKLFSMGYGSDDDKPALSILKTFNLAGNVVFNENNTVTIAITSELQKDVEVLPEAPVIKPRPEFEIPEKCSVYKEKDIVRNPPVIKTTKTVGK